MSVMKKKNILLFFIFVTHFLSAQGGPPPPGCRVYTEFDDDNDGFAQFDLDTYFVQFRNSALTTGTGYDLSGYQIEFYPSETDYNQGTNQITSSPYTNVVSYEQTCFMKLVYSGTGPFYDPMELSLNFACHKLETTNTLTTITQIQDLIQLYPNPVSSYFNIKCKKETTFTASIYDINGRLLIKGNATASIDVSELKNGIYLVKVVTERKEFTRKITVAH
jgi:Secretion system C-terminal sorting domain